QLLLQFRLTGQDDLQQFAPGRLRVQDHSNLIESLWRQRLGLIQNQHGQIVSSLPLQKPMVQGLAKVALALGRTRHPEIGEDQSQQSDWFHTGVEDESRRAPTLAQPMDYLVQSTGLAGPSFPGEHQKALARLDAEH